MGLKKLFGKRRSKEPQENKSQMVAFSDDVQEDEESIELQNIQETAKLEKENVDLTNKASRCDYIQRLYEGIQEAKKQCQGIKSEYGQVTSYLKDIQLMDQAPEEEKQLLKETAGAIVELTRERQRLKGKRYKFTDAQKTALDNFESKAREDIQNLREYEEYQIKIKHDMRQLASEKQLLIGDRHDIVRRQNTLRLVSKVLGFLLAMFGLLLVVILFVFNVDIQVPFLATAAFAFLVALMIVKEARKNRTEMVVTERKCSRAASLSNRVKIKYVNNTRTIDYMCSKYHVRNGTELEFVYDQYCKAKREWARQQEDAFLLDEKHKILMAELQRLGIKDREIWFGQAKAMIEPKEMVEVRHDLNEQRRKLRAQIDYNNGIMQDFLAELERIQNLKPEYEQDIEDLIGKRG